MVIEKHTTIFKSNYLFLSKIYALMKNYIFLLLIFLSLFSCQSEAEKQSERKAIIDSTVLVFQKEIIRNQIDSLVAQEKFNGSISISQHQQSLYEKFSGFESFKTKKKLDENSVFAIASISKQFTAVQILLLQDENKLNTTDFVSQFLPEFKKQKFDKITIHHLLTHTSGINDFGDNLIFEVGKDYSYSNKGYNYLGKIIEKVSGESYDEMLKTLFSKVRMQNTTTAKFSKNAHFASANVGNTKNVSEVENMPERLSDASIGTAAGGILSTIHDLHIWNEKLYSGNILKNESLSHMTEKHITREHFALGNVGYGYGIMSNLKKPKAYFHTGYVKGAPSLLIYYPSSKTSVVILSNFANESLGKEGVFILHRKVKDIMDVIENSVIALNEKMEKTIEK